MRLMLLGTAGGPMPSPDRGAPAQAIVVDGRCYVVDAGNGVAYRLLAAGLGLDSLAAVFLTHHHIDHSADLGNLVTLAWSTHHLGSVVVAGPPPLASFVEHHLAMHADDIAERESYGRAGLGGLLDVRETRGGVVHRDGDLTVTAATVAHAPGLHSLAYRFETPGRTVVISGDTAPCDSVVDLAARADVLVHEAYLPERLLAVVAAGGADPTRVTEAFERIHTTAEQAGAIAAMAGVSTLVLSHLIPATGAPDAEWIEAAGRHFDGEIIVGSDLAEL
ncbi:MBL fold metallo-hydrolase [Pseudonocardia acaciae]|uniref:MBL fold metallo-hydrolase n=1 Tax=Pseudonocardia acaciae TaxID=551276 RepID=UPI00055F74E8|nr:MBL fold metallo-hydrolase [Pseudonocardia acaciae]